MYSFLSLQNAYLDSNSYSTLLFSIFYLKMLFIRFNMFQEYFQPYLVHLKHTPFTKTKLSRSRRKNIFSSNGPNGAFLKISILFYMCHWLSCLLLNHPWVEEKRNERMREIGRWEEKAELSLNWNPWSLKHFKAFPRSQHLLCSSVLVICTF